MKTTIIGAALLTLVAGAARAEGESNSQFFDNTAAGHFVVANQVLRDTGSESTPQYGRGQTTLSQGDILPTNGSEGGVQTVNSLPAGAEEGTVAYTQAQSVQRWVLEHRSPAKRNLAGSFN